MTSAMKTWKNIMTSATAISTAASTLNHAISRAQLMKRLMLPYFSVSPSVRRRTYQIAQMYRANKASNAKTASTVKITMLAAYHT